MRTIVAALAIGAGVLALSACASTAATSSSNTSQSGSNAFNAVPRPSATIFRQAIVGPKPKAWMNAKKSGSLIYVAAGNEVEIYPEAGTNPAQVGSITDGVDNSYGLFVDANR